jgi:flagellar motility protein MotE (MotC chaperone)
MAAKRKQKLKVYCTPVGFHDAYVAAPSQKAALEAWGAKTNLFGQGSAHQVTDEALTKVPLEHPGEVIKVLRGSDAEQLAALGRTGPPKQAAAKGRPTEQAQVVKLRGPKPSRTELNKAEDVLEALQSRHAKQLQQIEEEEERLARRRHELEQKQAKELASAKGKVEEEQEQYDRTVRIWGKGG